MQWTGAEMTCTRCGPEDGILEIRFDLDRVGAAWRHQPLGERPHSHWRYRELLPLDPAGIPHDWPVGWTPIIALPKLAAELGVSRLLVKDEGRNPTGSLKDRASSVAVAHALQVGARTIACASTGNAATSLAGHAALAGMRAVIFVPQKAAEPKLAQMCAYGATVFAVAGPYANAYSLCSAACARFGWVNRNCAINPVLVEGKKTAGLELAEQCVEIDCMPDWVAVSIGDGCTIAGIWKGLTEMHALGVIRRLPKLLGVQASVVAPVRYALRHGRLPQPDERTTIADGIDVPVPRNWRKAVQAVQSSNGTILAVTDRQILAALAQAGRHGIFGEPAAAAAIAGVRAAAESGLVGTDDRVLAFNTGSGLKDTTAALQAVGRPVRIDPDLDRVAAVLGTVE
jgi:threonine synthase